jgi:hypothetical protein
MRSNLQIDLTQVQRHDPNRNLFTAYGASNNGPYKTQLDHKLYLGIADDVLRDLYVRGKYRDVILPMTTKKTTKRPASTGRRATQ